MKGRRLYKGDKVIRVLTPLGLLTGTFIATIDDLPLLVTSNKSSQGHIYFRWSGMKTEECM